MDKLSLLGHVIAQIKALAFPLWDENKMQRKDEKDIQKIFQHGENIYECIKGGGEKRKGRG